MFRTSIALALALVLMGLAKSQAAEPVGNADLQKQLVGKWFEELDFHGFHIKATVTYEADGKLSTDGVLTRGNRRMKLIITGSWKAEGDKLTETVATCWPPLLRRGRQATSVIVELSDSVFRYVNEDGD